MTEHNAKQRRHYQTIREEGRKRKGVTNPHVEGTFAAFCWEMGYRQDVRSIDELSRDWNKQRNRVEARSLPKIDDVCIAFHVFQQEMARALVRYAAMSADQNRAFEGARTTLRHKLIELGLAEHIDWTE